MDVENRSLYHATTRLKPVIDFVVARVPALALARLRIVDAAWGYFSSGHAWKVDPSIKTTDTDLVCPSLIEVRLSHHLKYPATTQYVRELAPVQVSNLKEELVLVLAHEAQHITQAWGFKKYTVREKELDAETFAIATLAAWRGA